MNTLSVWCLPIGRSYKLRRKWYLWGGSHLKSVMNKIQWHWVFALDKLPKAWFPKGEISHFLLFSFLPFHECDTRACWTMGGSAQPPCTGQPWAIPTHFVNILLFICQPRGFTSLWDPLLFYPHMPVLFLPSVLHLKAVSVALLLLVMPPLVILSHCFWNYFS